MSINRRVPLPKYRVVTAAEWSGKICFNIEYTDEFDEWCVHLEGKTTLPEAIAYIRKLQEIDKQTNLIVWESDTDDADK